MLPCLDSGCLWKKKKKKKPNQTKKNFTIDSKGMTYFPYCDFRSFKVTRNCWRYRPNGPRFVMACAPSLYSLRTVSFTQKPLPFPYSGSLIGS